MILEHVTFINDDGEMVERLCLDIEGHDVQVLCFDGRTKFLNVWVDEEISLVPFEDVEEYIRSKVYE